MSQQVPIDPAARANDTYDHGIHAIGPDLGYQRSGI